MSTELTEIFPLYNSPVYTEIVISQLAAVVLQHFYIVIPRIVLTVVCGTVVPCSEGIVRVLSER